MDLQGTVMLCIYKALLQNRANRRVADIFRRTAVPMVPRRAADSQCKDQPYSIIATGNYYVVTTDANGCSAASDTIYYFVLGLDETKVLDIQIMPNPSNCIFNLYLGQQLKEGKLEVYDIVGNLIQAIELTDGLTGQIDLSHEGAGTYLVRLNAAEWNTNLQRITSIR